MSTTQTSTAAATANTSATVDTKLEVVAVQVSDIDRAKRFYESLGWKLDADFMIGKNFRAVQLTPPGSLCSIHLAKTGVPGSTQGTFLVVSDLQEARKTLTAQGANVSDVFHFDEEYHLCRERTREATRTSRMPPSTIPTGMDGCFSKSRRGFPDGDSAGTCRH